MRCLRVKTEWSALSLIFVSYLRSLVSWFHCFFVWWWNTIVYCVSLLLVSLFLYSLVRWKVNATRLSFADRYTNRRTKGLTMLVVRVILGHAYPHTGDTPVNALPCSQPDCMTPSCGTHRRYDSLVAGKGKLFKEFLMYDTNRCFPQFLITYDRVMKQPKKCCFWVFFHLE